MWWNYVMMAERKSSGRWFSFSVPSVYYRRSIKSESPLKDEFLFRTLQSGPVNFNDECLLRPTSSFPSESFSSHLWSSVYTHLYHVLLFVSLWWRQKRRQLVSSCKRCWLNRLKVKSKAKCVSCLQKIKRWV